LLCTRAVPAALLNSVNILLLSSRLPAPPRVSTWATATGLLRVRPTGLVVLRSGRDTHIYRENSRVTPAAARSSNSEGASGGTYGHKGRELRRRGDKAGSQNAGITGAGAVEVDLGIARDKAGALNYNRGTRNHWRTRTSRSRQAEASSAGRRATTRSHHYIANAHGGPSWHGGCKLAGRVDHEAGRLAADGHRPNQVEVGAREHYWRARHAAHAKRSCKHRRIYHAHRNGSRGCREAAGSLVGGRGIVLPGQGAAHRIGRATSADGANLGGERARRRGRGPVGATGHDGKRRPGAAVAPGVGSVGYLTIGEIKFGSISLKTSNVAGGA
nr:hypothetical protein [Tanacetum cinerariifolium]